nr:pyridine nucleotide-disulfide oxidoreductase [arsenite-oxidising bacterium NT-25]
MIVRPYLALTRRTFLLSVGATIGATTFPLMSHAAEPVRSATRAVAFDGDALLAAGATFSRSDDGGKTSQVLPAPANITSLAARPDRAGRIVGGLASGGVAFSDDGGRTWEIRSTGLAKGEVLALAVAASEPELIYASVRGDGLWKSEDAGRSWSLAMDRPWLEGSERDVRALASVELETGMGGIWIYAGTRVGLTRVPDCFCRWQDVQPGDAMDALVSGDAPPSVAPLPQGEPILALASALSSPETLYAGLPSGIWMSRDGGVVWSNLTKGFASAVAVHPTDDNFLIAAFGDITKLSRDSGATWSALAAS